MKTIDAEKLRAALDYDPESGIFRRKVATLRFREPGGVAGTLLKDKGYIQIMIDYTWYMAHRLAWVYMTGSMPSQQIDHINGDRADNRWSNLREASPSQNQHNKRWTASNSGIKGVSWNKRKNRWFVSIKLNHRSIYVGMYKELPEAAEAVRIARQKLHGDFANHGDAI